MRIFPLINIAVLVTALLVSTWGTLAWQSSLWDRFLFDSWTSITAGDVDSDIVLIEIDEQSLQAYGRWPWSRQRYADLIDVLNAAKASSIVMDLVLVDPNSADPNGDAALEQSAKNYKKLVLPILPIVDGTNIEVLKPFGSLANSAKLGHIETGLGEDGVLRHVFLRGGVGVERFPALALAALELSQSKEGLPGARRPMSQDESTIWERDFEIMSPFNKTVPSGQRFSFADVVSGKIPPLAFRDKQVFVGVVVSSISKPASVSGLQARSMMGGELHASLYEQLRQHRNIQPLGDTVTVLLNAIFLTFAALLVYRLQRYPRPSLVALCLPLGLAGSGLLLFAGGWYWPQGPSVMGLSAIYLLWLVYRLRFYRYAAGVDQETGMFDRALYEIALQQAWDNCAKTNAKVAVIVIEVDALDRYRDYYGEAETEKLWRKLGRLIDHQASRPNDLLAKHRSSGVVLFMSDIGNEVPSTVAQRIHDIVAEEKLPHATSPIANHITLSIGVALRAAKIEESSNVITVEGEAALFSAQKAGGNRIHIA